MDGFPLRIEGVAPWRAVVPSSSAAEWNPGYGLFDYLLNNNPEADGVKDPTVLQPTFKMYASPNGRVGLTNAQIQPPGNIVQPLPEYEAERAEIVRNLPREGVWVYQRAYSVTTATSHRPFLTTGSISPCICVVVHKLNTAPPRVESNAVAAMAHFDKGQDYRTLKEVLDLPDFATGDVRIHFYGGCKKDNSSILALKGLLNAVYQHNLAHGRFILTAFDVLNIFHTDSLTFDVRNGNKHTVSGTLEFLGFWLDSYFRLWPDGVYIPIDDSSNMAIRANKQVEQGSPFSDEFRKVRLQWDGGNGAHEFWDISNELITQQIMKQVFEDPAAINQVNKRLFEGYRGLLVAKKQPMAFEQSLKLWMQWKALNAKEQKTTAENERLPNLRERALGSIVGVIITQAASKKLPTEGQMAQAIDQWVKTYLQTYADRPELFQFP